MRDLMLCGWLLACGWLVGCHARIDGAGVPAGGDPAGGDGTGSGGGGSDGVDLGGGEGGGTDGGAAGDLAPGSGGFHHPGILVDAAQLASVKAKVAAGTEPWATAFKAARAHRLASKSYVASPIAVVECGSFSNPDIGCTAEKDDADAAYTQALLFALTDDATYAKNAAAILDAWATTLTSHTNSNAPLQSAWVASVFPRAAEILRATYPSWTGAARFGAFLRKVYLPEIVNGAANQNGNWELSMIEAIVDIAVYVDDRALFDQGVAMWRKRVPAYIYLASDGAYPVPPPGGNKKTPAQLIAYWQGQSTFVDGLGQETCRDFGHLTLGFAAMINAAETARLQGVDLFSEAAARVTAGLEFNAQYLDGVAAPASLCGGTLNLPGNPTWEIAYAEYAGRLGHPLPHVHNVVVKGRPSGITHHIAWETLTHAIP